MTTLGRPRKWTEHQAEWVRLYNEEKLTQSEIARKYGIGVATVSRYLHEAGVTIEKRVRNPNAGRTPEDQAKINERISVARKGKGTGPRVSHERRACEQCGEPYTYLPSKTGTRFCSRKCREASFGPARARASREAYSADPRYCPCGESIPYEYRHTRQYCNALCRNLYQAKRQRDESNYITFDCYNCGKEVTRYRNYGNGNNMYCSNACAYRHTRTKQHIVVENSIVLDSSWEALFWSLCSFVKLPVQRFDRQYGIAWRENGWYAPDFWLPTLSIAVEIKGVTGEEDAEKWRLFRENQRLAIMGRQEMETARKSVELTQYLKALAA